MNRDEVAIKLAVCIGMPANGDCEECLVNGKCPFTDDPDNDKEWAMMPIKLIKEAIKALKEEDNDGLQKPD